MTDWDGLMATGDVDPPAPRIAFSRLYEFAADADPAGDPEICAALESDARLAGDFRRILERMAAVRLPRVAAAGSGPIGGRDGEGCRIRFEPSQAESTQTYVIIELADAAAEPAALFIVDAEPRCLSFAMPAARDGIIQLLEDDRSALLAGLRDIKTEVFLR